LSITVYDIVTSASLYIAECWCWRAAVYASLTIQQPYSPTETRSFIRSLRTQDSSRKYCTGAYKELFCWVQYDICDQTDAC